MSCRKRLNLKISDALKLSLKQAKIHAKLCIEFSFISPWFLKDLFKIFFKPRGSTNLKKKLALQKYLSNLICQLKIKSKIQTKFKACDSDWKSLKLIHSCYSNRKQRAKLSNTEFRQGSLLRSLLFKIFICDMFFFLHDFIMQIKPMTL